MNDLLHYRREVSTLILPLGVNGGPIDFNATGDKYIYTPCAPIDVYRWGFITDAAMDPDAGGFVLALDHRITAGSDTGRTEKATITRADLETVAAGKLVYGRVEITVAETVAVDGSKVNVDPAGPLRVNPGEQVVIEVTNAVGAASTGYVFIDYADLAFNKADADVILETV